MSFFIQNETQFIKYSYSSFSVDSFQNGSVNKFEFYNDTKGLRDVTTGQFLKFYFGNLIEVQNYIDNDPYMQWTYDGTTFQSGNLYYMYVDPDTLNVVLDLYKSSTFKLVYNNTNPIPIIPTNIFDTTLNTIKLKGDLLFYGGQYSSFGYFNSFGGFTIYVKFSTYGPTSDSETIFYRHGSYYGYVPQNWETSLKRIGTSDQFRLLIRQNYNYHIHQSTFGVTPGHTYTLYISVGDDYTTNDDGRSYRSVIYYNFYDNDTNLQLAFYNENGTAIENNNVLTTDGPYNDTVDILIGASRNDNDPSIYENFLNGGEITEFQFYDHYVSYDAVAAASNPNLSTSNIWGPYSKTLDYKYIISGSQYYSQNQSNVEYTTSTNVFMTLTSFTLYSKFTITSKTTELLHVKNDQGNGIRIFRFDTGDTFVIEVTIDNYINQIYVPILIGENTIILQNGIDNIYCYVNNFKNIITGTPLDVQSYIYTVTLDDTAITDYRMYTQSIDIISTFGVIYNYTGNSYTITPNAHIYGDFINLDTKTYMSLNSTSLITNASATQIMGSKDGIFFDPIVEYDSNYTYRFIRTIFEYITPQMSSNNYWTNDAFITGYLAKDSNIHVNINGPFKYSVNNVPFTIGNLDTYTYTSTHPYELISVDLTNVTSYNVENLSIPTTTYIPSDIQITQINHNPKGIIQTTLNAAIDDRLESSGIYNDIYEPPTTTISSLQSIQNVTNFTPYIDVNIANAISFTGFTQSDITLDTTDTYTISKTGDYYEVYIDTPTSINIYGISNGYTVTPMIDTTPVETIYITEYAANDVFLASRVANVFTQTSPSSNGATWINNGTNQSITFSGNCTFANAITSVNINIQHQLFIDETPINTSEIYVQTDHIYTFRLILTNTYNIPDADVLVDISSIKFKGDIQVQLSQINNSFTQYDDYTSIGSITNVSLNNGELSNGMTLFWTNQFEKNPLILHMNVFQTSSGNLVQSLSSSGADSTNGITPDLKFTDTTHTFDLGNLYTENTNYTCVLSWSPDSSGLSPISVSNITSYIVNDIQLTQLQATGSIGPVTGSVYSTGVPNWSPDSFSIISGVQYWNLPYTMNLKITVAGASGNNGSGGRGTIVSNTFIINHNDILKFVVGQSGTSGGGGGSFVLKSIDGGVTYTPLIIAGGGGYSHSEDAVFTPTSINNNPIFTATGSGGGWGGGITSGLGGGMNPGTSYDSTNQTTGTATAAEGTTGYNTFTYGFITIHNESTGPSAFNYINLVTPTINTATISINYMVYSPTQNVHVFRAIQDVYSIPSMAPQSITPYFGMSSYPYDGYFISNFPGYSWPEGFINCSEIQNSGDIPTFTNILNPTNTSAISIGSGYYDTNGKFGPVGLYGLAGKYSLGYINPYAPLNFGGISPATFPTSNNTLCGVVLKYVVPIPTMFVNLSISAVYPNSPTYVFIFGTSISYGVLNPWVQIGGPIACDFSNTSTVTLSFVNTNSYQSYAVVFPTIANPNGYLSLTYARWLIDDTSNVQYNVYSEISDPIGTLENPPTIHNLNPGWTYSVYSYIPTIGTINSFGDPTYAKVFKTLPKLTSALTLDTSNVTLTQIQISGFRITSNPLLAGSKVFTLYYSSTGPTTGFQAGASGALSTANVSPYITQTGLSSATQYWFYTSVPADDTYTTSISSTVTLTTSQKLTSVLTLDTSNVTLSTNLISGFRITSNPLLAGSKVFTLYYSSTGPTTGFQAGASGALSTANVSPYITQTGLSPATQYWFYTSVPADSIYETSISPVFTLTTNKLTSALTLDTSNVTLSQILISGFRITSNPLLAGSKVFTLYYSSTGPTTGFQVGASGALSTANVSPYITQTGLSPATQYWFYALVPADSIYETSISSTVTLTTSPKLTSNLTLDTANVTLSTNLIAGFRITSNPLLDGSKVFTLYYSSTGPTTGFQAGASGALSTANVSPYITQTGLSPATQYWFYTSVPADSIYETSISSTVTLTTSPKLTSNLTLDTSNVTLSTNQISGFRITSNPLLAGSKVFTLYYSSTGPTTGFQAGASGALSTANVSPYITQTGLSPATQYWFYTSVPADDTYTTSISSTVTLTTNKLTSVLTLDTSNVTLSTNLISGFSVTSNPLLAGSKVFTLYYSSTGPTTGFQAGASGALSTANVSPYITQTGLSSATQYWFYALVPSDSIYETSISSTVTLTTINSPVSSSGGTKTGPVTIGGNNYYIHTFTTSGTFTVSGGSGTITSDILLVGGGGGCAGYQGGGAGGGGLIFRPGLVITNGTYTVTVGNGGVGTFGNGNGNNGGNTTFNTLTALGGAGGIGQNNSVAGTSGGSGGGACVGSGNSYNAPGGSALQRSQTGDSGTYGYGNAGGGNSNGYLPGGGGGAGGSGVNGGGAGGGAGGVGLCQVSTYNFATVFNTTSFGQLSGGNIYFSGGGAGGYGSGQALGGGGGGGGDFGAGGNGTPNTGGGAGGAGNGFGGVDASGGSGIVILRYRV